MTSPNEPWRPLEDEDVEEIAINKESEPENQDAMTTFKTKLPLIIQSMVFGIAYYNLAPWFLQLLNKYIFKSAVKFSWTLYDVARR